MIRLPGLMVAPNGARLGPEDHPMLPISLPQIIETASACFDTGADGLHLHLRDAEGRHLLDAGLYRQALTELKVAVPDMRIQITTESNGQYKADHQRAVALSAGASLVSISVREMANDTPVEVVADFYVECAAADIAVQHILYDTTDFELLSRILPDALFNSADLQLIFVLGRYSDSKNGSPTDLDPFLEHVNASKLQPDWAVCAFGKGETACLQYGYKMGGKCRVGFENSILRGDGSIAHDNAQRVADIADVMAPARKP